MHGLLPPAFVLSTQYAIPLEAARHTIPYTKTPPAQNFLLCDQIILAFPNTLLLCLL